MKLHRRALTESTLVGLVIILVVSVLLTAGVVKWAHSMNQGGDLEKCRLSVLAASQAKILGKAALSIDCPRKDLTIKPEDVKVDNALSDDSVKKMLAEEITSCWYKMSGDSQINPYDQDWFLTTRSVCLVCAEIGFDKELQEKIPKVENFRSFLEREGYLDKNKMGGKLSYMTNYVVITYVDTTNKAEIVDFIDTSKKYYLVYLTFSSQWFFEDKRWYNQLSQSLGLGQGVFGAVNSISIINLIPADQISSLRCGTLKG